MSGIATQEELTVCVAVCNYNHEQYLEQSIRSILNQDHELLDVVVVDDGSTSNEAEAIAMGFKDDRIRFVRFERNMGKWSALNHAFSTTTAQVCTSHDADDVSLPWRLSSQLSTMASTNTAHNLCGFEHCWQESEVEEGLGRARPSVLKHIPQDDVLKAVSAGYQSPGCNHYYTGQFETAGTSAMFAKWVWDIGFRFNPPGHGLRVLHSEDSDFNCRVTLGLRSTSILAEKPYLYRRNTSTNKEEK